MIHTSAGSLNRRRNTNQLRPKASRLAESDGAQMPNSAAS